MSPLAPAGQPRIGFLCVGSLFRSGLPPDGSLPRRPCPSLGSSEPTLPGTCTPQPAPMTGALMVSDLDAAMTRATSTGGTLVNGPMPVPGGARVVQFIDPQGAMFALVGV